MKKTFIENILFTTRIRTNPPSSRTIQKPQLLRILTFRIQSSKSNFSEYWSNTSPFTLQNYYLYKYAIHDV